MGGTDISSTAVSGNTITISNVTGNIIITVTTTATSSSQGQEIAKSINDFTLFNVPEGSITLVDGALNSDNTIGDKGSFASAYFIDSNVKTITCKIVSGTSGYYNKWIVYKVDSEYVYFVCLASSSGTSLGQTWKLSLNNGGVVQDTKLTIENSLNSTIKLKYENNNLIVEKDDIVLCTIEGANAFGVVYSASSGNAPIIEELKFFE